MKTETKRRLIENVMENSDRTPFEKETALHFDKTTDVARMQSAEMGIMRRLLIHPEFDLSHLTVRDDDGDVRTIESDELVDEYDGEDITYVVGDIPIGCLKIKGTSRKTGTNADVVAYLSLDDEEGEDDV